MCEKHMYQRLLWVNTSHFMFSLIERLRFLYVYVYDKCVTQLMG